MIKYPDVADTRQRLLVFSAAIIIDGLAVIALPFIDSRVHPNVFAGCALLIAGLLHLAFAWPFRSVASVMWQLLLATAAVAIGLYLIGRESWPVEDLRAAVAMWLLADGLVECGLYAGAARSERRVALLMDGIVTVLSSACVWFAWPFDDARLVAALVGLNVVLSGVTRVFVALGLPRSE